ncbi:mitochondrial carrier domain-containing protein [Mariannaea sp. PMI_226]|nr:mitochondrial carrier domain-containing protein [Mariannaea sp. PMI_226]
MTSHDQHSPEAGRPPSPEFAVSSYGLAAAEPQMLTHTAVTPVHRWALHASDSQFNALAGAIGGFTSGIVTCPLDVIKTKLQAQGAYTAINKGRHVGHPKLYNGLVGTASVIWREEGVRGLYRGLGPIVMGYLPTWAVWFTVYNKCKVWLGQHHENTFVINLWSSIIAGASSTIVTNPIWVIKTRLMSQSHISHLHHENLFPKPGSTPTARPTLQAPWHYRSTLDAARKMYTSEGIMSFYSGLTPALLGLTHVAVQFPTYEYFKKSFTGQAMGEAPSEGDGRQWVGILSASILSKILASSATYPHEVIRTRLQTQRRPVAGEQFMQDMGANPDGSAQKSTRHIPKYRGVVHTFRTILAEEGWRAFYAGLGTNMMRAVPAATVTMLTYEYVMKNLNKTKAEAQILLSR